MSAAVHSHRTFSEFHRWPALLLTVAALLFAAPAWAEDEEHRDVQIGPFHATGEWTVKETSVRGKGVITAPWGGAITITATYDTEKHAGNWKGSLSHPVLGQVSNASGRISQKGLEFRQKIDLGPGTATLDFLLAPDHLTGEGQATLKAGKVSFGRVGLKFEDGDLTTTSAAQVRLPGVSTPMAATIKFRGVTFDSATGTGKVVLGPYAFQAQLQINQRGDVALNASQSQTLPGIGAVEMTLAYANGQVSAAGTRTVNLGNIAFDNTTITLDRSGKVTLSRTSSVDLPGLGTTQLTLKYANGVLSASGSRDISLGSYAFSNTAIALSSNGTVTLSKTQSVNIPGLGSTQMALAYANGVLSASGSRDVSLGSFLFSSAAVSLSSNGTVTLSKTQSVTIPGLGSTQMALAYANGVLSASGSRDISLGSYAFSNTDIAVSSNGTVTLSKTEGVNIPGLGSTQMALAYANGVLSASGSRDISLGSYAFSNTAIALSSNGTVTLSKTQSVNIPGLGSTQMALAYANGVLSASGSRDISLGSYAFSNTDIAVSSNGTVTLSKTEGVNIPGLGSTQMTLTYANGVLSASGSRDISLGSYAFSNTAIALSSNGTVTLSKTQSVNIPGLGSTQMALAYANGVLSASGSRDVSLGSFLFSSAAVSLSSNGTVTLSKTQSVTIPGLGSTQMALAYANGVLSASGSRDVRLGNFVFSSAAVSLSSNGTVTLSKTQSVNIPGLGSTQMTLGYADGVLSAAGSRDVSLGNFLFSSAGVSLSSNGTVTLSKTQSVNIAGIGNANLALGYANGEATANGTAAITVSFLSHSVNFGSAAVHVSSSGGVSVSASQGINIGPVHYNVSISYENGSIKVHY